MSNELLAALIFAPALLGMIAWAYGVYLSYRFDRAYARRYGRDVVSETLNDAFESTVRRPWTYPRPVIGAIVHVLRFRTTPVADADLERLRTTARLWLGVGIGGFWATLILFLAPVLWLLITRW